MRNDKLYPEQVKRLKSLKSRLSSASMAYHRAITQLFPVGIHITLPHVTTEKVTTFEVLYVRSDFDLMARNVDTGRRRTVSISVIEAAIKDDTLRIHRPETDRHEKA